MASKSEVAEIIRMLLDAYPQREFNNIAGFVDTAARVLVDVDAESLHAGALDCIADLKFFPSLAELRDRAKKAKLSGHAKVEQPGIKPEIVLARKTQHLADKDPRDWTRDDYAEYKRWYGREVWWMGEPK